MISTTRSTQQALPFSAEILSRLEFDLVLRGPEVPAGTDVELRDRVVEVQGPPEVDPSRGRRFVDLELRQVLRVSLPAGIDLEGARRDAMRFAATIRGLSGSAEVARSKDEVK